MKRLIGGLFLLSLLAISLDLNAGETNITDASVLEQLTNLREFIDEKRDFTKESKGLKPVLVQYRSNASKIDGIVQCNLSFNTDALHLSIGGYSVQADGTPITITINVVYEWTEYIGYTIKSAKLNATNDLKTTSFNGIAPTSSDNGKVLGVDANGDYELKTISGVTPLYWHGLDMYDSTKKNCFQGHILKNDALAIDSIAKLKTWFENIPSSYIAFSGNGVVAIDNVYHSLLAIKCIKVSDTITYQLLIAKDDGYENITIEDLNDYFVSVDDASNQVL